MTLRGRLTAAFLAVVLGPVLLGAFFVGGAVSAVSRERSTERLDRAVTAVGTSVGALCQQLHAAAGAVAAVTEPDRPRGRRRPGRRPRPRQRRPARRTRRRAGVVTDAARRPRRGPTAPGAADAAGAVHGASPPGWRCATRRRRCSARTRGAARRRGASSPGSPRPAAPPSPCSAAGRDGAAQHRGRPAARDEVVASPRAAWRPTRTGETADGAVRPPASTPPPGQPLPLVLSVPAQQPAGPVRGAGRRRRAGRAAAPWPPPGGWPAPPPGRWPSWRTPPSGSPTATSTPGCRCAAGDEVGRLGRRRSTG